MVTQSEVLLAIKTENIEMFGMLHENGANLFPTTDAQQISEVLLFLKENFDQREVLGLKESKDLFRRSKALGDQTLLEYIMSKNNLMIKQRDELIDLLKMQEDDINPTWMKSEEKVMDLLKEHINAGPGLVGCLDYVEEKYPWSQNKVRFMTSVSVLVLFMCWLLSAKQTYIS